MAPSDEIIESTRITEVDGNTWPCFVFPDHSVPDGAIEPRTSKQALPVLILKRLKFVWRNRNELTEFDPFTTIEARGERKQAFDEALDYHNLDFYHSLVWNKYSPVIVDDSDDSSDNKPRKHISLDDDDDVEITSITKKRPYSSVFKRPGLPSPSPTPIKKAKISSNVGSSLPFAEDDSDVELPHPSTFTETSMKKPAPKPAVTPWKPSGKKFIIPDDYVTKKQLDLFMRKKGDGEPSPPPKKVEPVKDPLKVNIYVGGEQKLFVLDRAVVQKHPTIMKHITGDIKNGFDIRSSTFKKFDPTTFESIVSWLKTSDYAPRLMEGKYPYLENVKSAAQFEEAAQASSVLWNIGHKLGLTSLQQLIYRKIEVQSPLAANSLLMLTRMVFWNAPTNVEVDGKMRQMLKQNLAARLWEVLEEETLLFIRVVRPDTELANYIWQHQIEHPHEESPEQPSDEDDGDDDDD